MLKGKRGYTMSEIDKKLSELGIELPEPRKPLAAYVPTVITGKLLYTSGNTPGSTVDADGSPAKEGHLGAELTVEDGYRAARICAINCLAAVKQALGDLDRVDRVVKLLGFVSSAPGFNDQPLVMNGASELLVQVFGENGEHARSAIGVNELPGNASVEVEMILALK